MPLIPNGARLFFDSSTTVYCLARCLANTQNLLVVTDTLTTALELNSRTNIHVMCLGGELQKNTNSCSGIFAENMLQSMRFDYAFIGLYGISADGYLSTPSTSEFSLKRTVIEHSAHTVVLIDSSKLDGLSLTGLLYIEIQKIKALFLHKLKAALRCLRGMHFLQNILLSEKKLIS